MFEHTHKTEHKIPPKTWLGKLFSKGKNCAPKILQQKITTINKNKSGTIMAFVFDRAEKPKLTTKTQIKAEITENNL